MRLIWMRYIYICMNWIRANCFTVPSGWNTFPDPGAKISANRFDFIIKEAMGRVTMFGRVDRH